MSQVNFAFLLIYYEFYFAAVRAQPALPRTGVFGMRNPRRRAPFRITPRALAKFGRPKNACVFEGGRIWLSPRKRAVAAATARFLPLNRSIDFNVYQCF